MTDTIYYAIGDIHGEADKLARLHDNIALTHTMDYSGRLMHIVHLGDYVDRGPNSYGVIERLMKMDSTEDKAVTHLKGNHEVMMAQAFDDKTGGETSQSMTFWTRHGGLETLESYRKYGYDRPPDTHLDWINGLETYHWDQDAKLIFVHAGITPQTFPHDGADIHLWTRTERFFNSDAWPDSLPKGTKVIHGHTPTQSNRPDVTTDAKRVNVDTGACYGGPLTAAILAPEEAPRFISVLWD